MLEGVDVPLGIATTLLDNGVAETVSRILPFLFSLTILPAGLQVHTQHANPLAVHLPGALLAAVLFEVSKSIFVLYVDNYANYEQVYGSLASVIVLLAWTYFSGLILITGAEFTSEYERMRHDVERGQVVSRHDRVKSRGTGAEQ